MPSSSPPATPSGTATRIEASVTIALCPLAEDRDEGEAGRRPAAPAAGRRPCDRAAPTTSDHRDPGQRRQDLHRAGPLSAQEAGRQERPAPAGRARSITRGDEAGEFGEGEEPEAGVVQQPFRRAVIQRAAGIVQAFGQSKAQGRSAATKERRAPRKAPAPANQPARRPRRSARRMARAIASAPEHQCDDIGAVQLTDDRCRPASVTASTSAPPRNIGATSATVALAATLPAVASAATGRIACPRPHHLGPRHRAGEFARHSRRPGAAPALPACRSARSRRPS